MKKFLLSIFLFIVTYNTSFGFNDITITSKEFDKFDIAYKKIESLITTKSWNYYDIIINRINIITEKTRSAKNKYLLWALKSRLEYERNYKPLYKKDNQEKSYTKYKISKDWVYYDWEKLKWVDLDTFVIKTNTYWFDAIDKNWFYNKWKKLIFYRFFDYKVNIDIIDKDLYIWDKEYFKVEWINVDDIIGVFRFWDFPLFTFSDKSWVYILESIIDKKGEFIGIKKVKITSIKDYETFKPIEFEFEKEDDKKMKYFEDKYAIYKDDITINNSELKVDIIHEKKWEMINLWKIMNYIGKTIYWVKKDGNWVYFFDWFNDKVYKILLTWIDYETFEIIDSNFAKDKNNVYQIIYEHSWARPEHYKQWQYLMKLDWANPANFEIVWVFGKDKNNIYNNYVKIIDKPDLSTFEFKNWVYQDKNNIYYYNRESSCQGADRSNEQLSRISWADKSTYKIITIIPYCWNFEASKILARDKNSFYFNNKKIFWTDSSKELVGLWINNKFEIYFWSIFYFNNWIVFSWEDVLKTWYKKEDLNKIEILLCWPHWYRIIFPWENLLEKYPECEWYEYLFNEEN